jgi:hypothetical protein
MIKNDESGRMWKEVALAYFNELYLHLNRVTEENTITIVGLPCYRLDLIVLSYKNP